MRRTTDTPTSRSSRHPPRIPSILAPACASCGYPACGAWRETKASEQTPLSQALVWAFQGDVRQATLWFGSERLQDRWRDDRAIITLVSSSGPLAPVRFIAWLRATYRAGDLAKLRMVAQVLGIDPTRIDLDRRSGESVDEQHEEWSEQQ